MSNMKKWDKKRLLQWVDCLEGYSTDKIKKIKDGINQYGATGDDVWDAEKSELKECLNIDGLLAKKLAKSISAQRNSDLGSNLSRNNINNGNNNSTETPFTLNIGGSTPTKLRNIKSSMNIGEIKRKYLEEHGQEITNTKMKGVNIKYLGEALNDESSTLKSYGILNGDGFQLFITYSLNGGMSSNDDEKKMNVLMITEKASGSFQIGKEIKCMDKNFVKGGYYTATVEAVEPDMIQIRWCRNWSHLTDTIPKTEWGSRIKGFQNDTEVTESNASQFTENSVNNPNPVNKPANNILKVDDDNHSTKVDDVKPKVDDDKLKVDEPNEKPKVDDGSNYHAIPMNKWNGIHTQYWVNSLGHPFPNYADKFNKINGVQLMDTNIDDLTVIISSKMVRKKLMKHLNSAKLKYIDKANDKNKPINNNNQYTDGCIVGLNNLGNTCFLNSCIQLLSHTPKLANYFAKRAKLLQTTDINANNNAKSNGFSLNPLNYISFNGWGNKDKNRNNHDMQHISMLNAWIKLCDKMYNYQSRSYAPTEIISALHQIDNHFGSGAQDDSARAMRFILQQLDKEIENEIFSNKNKGKQQNIGNINISEMNRYVINHSNSLDETEESMVIQELLRRHNPNDSIIRKLFDGVQRELIECIDCKNKFQQYVIFRDLDIPVINNHVRFINLNIIYNSQHHSIECEALSHCTIDVLKYKVIQSLKCSDICLKDVHIVTHPSSDVSDIKVMHSNTKISELASFSGGSIFALICKNSIDDDKKENTQHINASNANILQFVLFVDNNGDISSKFDTQFVNRNVYQFMVDDLKQYQLINGDKYYYQLLFNGANINISKLKEYNFKRLSKTDCNSLILLCIDKKNNDFPFYEFDKLDIRSLRESHTKYPTLSPHNALQRYKCDISKSNDSIWVQTLGLLFNDVQKDSKLHLNKIEQTLSQLKKKQQLSDKIDTWFEQFHSTSSAIQTLHNLEDCLATYQEKHILDRDSYEYTCRYCKIKCELIKMERTIVYTPPILIFHLDRFNNKNNVQPSRHMNTYKSATKFKKSTKVQVFGIADKKWHDAKIIQTNKNKVKISYTNCSSYFDEWINKDMYPTRIARRSNQSHSTYSTKFRHSVEYKMEICVGKTKHNLFGVANHSGSTSEYGHYTATVKSSTNGCWYNISDTSINHFSVDALGSTKTATIIMYSNIQ